jgi:hypothetical protein
MMLPGGYSLDSACANIVDNVYLGANPPPVPPFSALVLSTAAPALLILAGLVGMRRRSTAAVR